MNITNFRKLDTLIRKCLPLTPVMVIFQNPFKVVDDIHRVASIFIFALVIYTLYISSLLEKFSLYLSHDTFSKKIPCNTIGQYPNTEHFLKNVFIIAL